MLHCTLQAELAYQRAVEINEKAAAAWQGLAELYDNTDQPAKGAEAYQQLVSLGRGMRTGHHLCHDGVFLTCVLQFAAHQLMGAVG